MAQDKQAWAQTLLDDADIKINGSRPWDLTVHDPAVFDRVLSQGSLGFGESYMQGWWDCEALDVFFYKLFSAKVADKLKLSFPLLWSIFRAKFLNLQSTSRAFEVGQKHYDLGNDFFVKMLGPSLMYSCGYWKNAQNLDEAQYAKLDLICKKLNLQKGQRVLDIGSGWGAFAKFAAEKYGVSVVGVTVSKEQAEFARNLCKGLPVEFRLEDYRNLNEKFDHIISIGMFEHVGTKNYREYMQVAARCLKKDGLFLLHTIGKKTSADNTDPWVNKYIFPNGVLPSLKEISQNVEGLFIIEDVHNFGADYDKTLMAWDKNFEEHWPEFKNQYGEVFFKMWRFYLLAFAGSFRSRNLQLWQVTLSPTGVLGGHQSVR